MGFIPRRMDNMEEQYENNLSILNLYTSSQSEPNTEHIQFVKDVANGMRLEHGIAAGTGVLTLFLLCVKDTNNFELAKDVVEGVAAYAFSMMEAKETNAAINAMITGLIEQTHVESPPPIEKAVIEEFIRNNHQN
jgi:hypothetical protein